MKEVKIVRFDPSWSEDRREKAPNTRWAKETLTNLENEGFEVRAAAGMSNAGWPAFVILVRDR